MTAFKSGELHIQSVEPTDLQRTYGCKLRNTVTKRILASSALAQLIATDQLMEEAQLGARAAPQVLHSISQLIGWDSAAQLAELGRNKQQPTTDDHLPEPVEWRLLLPCALRAGRQQDLRWFYQQTGSAELVPLEEWAANRSLAISHLQLANGSSARAALQSAEQRSRAQKGASFSEKAAAAAAAQQTRLVVGASFVAIEWPRRAQSGRYVCQLAGKTMCDMNVIIRQPMKVAVRVQAESALDTPTGGAQMSPQGSDEMVDSYAERRQDSLLSRAVDWLSPRPRRHAPASERRPAAVQVRGRAHIKPPAVFSVGQRLRLLCLGSGFPIEGVRWFRNGQPLSAQNSQDFQLEISAAERGHAHAQEDGAAVLSSLFIRQLQPKHVGLSVFECFAHNALGEQARAGQLVVVADESLLESARASCPLREGVAAAGAPELEPEPDDESLFEELESGASPFAWPAEFKSTDKLSALMKQHNPFARALLLDSEPAELECPTAAGERSGNASGRVEWRRWSKYKRRASAKAPEVSTLTRTSQTLRTRAAGDKEMSESQARNFNQLFSADSRFVINGSSLQIRSPSKRHDEALYACRPDSSTLSSSSDLGSSKQSAASSGWKSPLQDGNHQLELELHQSSFASSSCQSLLARALFSDSRQAAEMSSIRIRIVGK